MHTSQSLTINAKQAIAGLALWFIAELCAFALVVSVFGIAGALLLGLLTSLIGFQLLRRLGRDAAFGLNQIFGTGGGVAFQPDALVDGTIAAIGGALLILPGFLSDLVGLALSTPSIRLWLAAKAKWFQRPGGLGTKARRDHVIDLRAGEWQRTGDAEPDFRRHG
jgi:UPF0716 protein FxsA